jgi:hypothetical protein
MSDDMKVINAPDRIYLQIGDDFDPGEVDFSALQEVTWRADNIHGTDIAYVRADALEAASARIAELDKERASTNRMFLEACSALGLIDEALGIDPDESGGAEPILESIDGLKAQLEMLRQELKNIANADTVAWDDPTEFEPWAKNRARHALAALAKQQEPQ